MLTFHPALVALSARLFPVGPSLYIYYKLCPGLEFSHFYAVAS